MCSIDITYQAITSWHYPTRGVEDGLSCFTFLQAFPCNCRHINFSNSFYTPVLYMNKKTFPLLLLQHTLRIIYNTKFCDYETEQFSFSNVITDVEKKITFSWVKGHTNESQNWVFCVTFIYYYTEQVVMRLEMKRMTLLLALRINVFNSQIWGAFQLPHEELALAWVRMFGWWVVFLAP